nr:MAG TPA: hypothetical protein [Crassvirales sp.]
MLVELKNNNLFAYIFLHGFVALLFVRIVMLVNLISK